MGSLKEQSWEPGDLVSGLTCLPASDLGHLTTLDLSVHKIKQCFTSRSFKSLSSSVILYAA